jgi:hypothetical protein
MHLRTTIAVAEELKRGGFADAAWVEQWDVAFAELYLDALDADMSGRTPTQPWAIAFDAPAALPPLRHVHLSRRADGDRLAGVNVTPGVNTPLLVRRLRTFYGQDLSLAGRGRSPWCEPAREPTVNGGGFTGRWR